MWWMAVVEFQPSSFSRGSYLNVGCMWLWIKSYVSFDVGYRVEEFQAFENEEQFTRVAERLATAALEKVRDYRRLFPTICHVSDYYMLNVPQSFWPCLNASIAPALAGRREDSARSLSTCLEGVDDDPAWLTKARLDARNLLAIIQDQERFRDSISSRVMEARRLQRLPTVTEIDFKANPRFHD